MRRCPATHWLGALAAVTLASVGWTQFPAEGPQGMSDGLGGGGATGGVGLGLGGGGLGYAGPRRTGPRRPGQLFELPPGIDALGKADPKDYTREEIEEMLADEPRPEAGRIMMCGVGRPWFNFAYDTHTPKTVESLVRIFQDTDDEWVGERVVWVLARQALPKLRWFWKSLLRSTAVPPSSYEAIARGLSKVGTDGDLVPLADPEPALRLEAQLASREDPSADSGTQDTQAAGPPVEPTQSSRRRRSVPQLSDFLGAVNVGGPDWHEYGLGWCRHDFSWGAIEPENGRFDWEKYDRLIEGSHQHAVQILPILDYTAPWAASKEGDVRSPPRRTADWEDFVERVVVRYSRPPFNLRYFQVWNEPTKKAGFWHGETDDEFFEKIHLPAAKIIKRYDCQVVFGGWPCSNSLDQLCALLDKYEAWRWTDILDLHYFGNSAWQTLHDRYVKTGKCRGIWQTEIGYHPFPGYLPNCYLRALHFGLRTGWEFPDQYKLFWYAFWGAGPDAPKCLTHNGPDGKRVPSEHGKRLGALNEVLGGRRLSAFTDFTTTPDFAPALEEEVPTVLGFRAGDRIVVALLIDADTRAKHLAIEVSLDPPSPPSRVILVGSTGDERDAIVEWRDGRAIVTVPVSDFPLELARNWGKKWEVATVYVVVE